MFEIKPDEMNFVPKRWGWELWICNSELYCGKILFIKQGKYCSFHYHEKKDEVLYVQSGKIWMTFQNKDEEPVAQHLSAGHAFHVTPGMNHQMEAIEDTYIIEFSTQHFDEDSYRVTTDLVRQNIENKPNYVVCNGSEELPEDVMEILKNTSPKSVEDNPDCERI